MDQDEAPPLAAVFEVIFDQKVGYTIAWKRALPAIDLDGVEYKSLPSGLHGVRQDLVYFTHGHYAAVSAFAQEEADERHRNASFVAVGALIPLSHGKLGRAWLHAPELRRLAKALVGNLSDTRSLELFWQKYRQGDKDSNGSTSPNAKRDSTSPSLKRKRGLSDASHGLKLTAGEARDHPALYMPALLESFGPLLFPLYRAALLRKRILLLGVPPVQSNCSAVYILSILSGIPQLTCEVFQPDKEPLTRAHPLFSVGISDIPTLSSQNGLPGWIATTTDDILGEKNKLWDLLVELAPSESSSRRRWPKMRTPDGKVVKATQRDMRRYRSLRADMKRLRNARRRYRDNLDRPEDDDDDDESPLMHPSTILKESAGPEDMQSGENEVVEAVSWTAMAYDSFMWWASAGEEDSWAKEEITADQKLLDDLPDLHDAMAQPSTDDDANEDKLHEAQETATVLTAYFHRLTALILQSLADIVEEADDLTEEGIEEDAIEVTTEDVRRMGLDTWSEQDKAFVQEALHLYFDRDAAVEKEELRLCGMRVC